MRPGGALVVDELVVVVDVVPLTMFEDVVVGFTAFDATALEEGALDMSPPA
jgi:hypothetical protein